jgi:DNA-binding MarR family transcriptional regulator
MSVLSLPESESAEPQRDIDIEVAGALLEITGPLQRALRRANADRSLTLAQAEVLRTVQHQPGIGVMEASISLQLAANTVSTLVNYLVARGLLDRRRDPDDGRRARLWVTEEAVRVLAARRALRRDAVGAGLTDLSAGDLAKLADALPALRRLLANLEARP